MGEIFFKLQNRSKKSLSPGLSAGPLHLLARVAASQADIKHHARVAGELPTL